MPVVAARPEPPTTIGPRAGAQRPPAAPDALAGRHVLLATDGGAAARSAGALVAALARTAGVHPVVVRAMSPMTALDAAAFATVPVEVPAPVGIAAVAHERGVVAAELREVAGEGVDWPVRVVVDAPPAAVLDEADAVDAALIVLGLRRHALADRLPRGTTLNAVLRDATVPVLAVTAGTPTAVRRIVVGVDFGRAGVRAARAALALLAASGAADRTLVLAYVAPADGDASEATEGARVIHAQGVAAAFARLLAEVRPPTGVRVGTAVLEGDPAEELAALADRSAADVIAVGSRRHGWLDHVLLGSVTAALVHRATRSVLVVPPN